MPVVATHFLHSQPTMPITLPPACQQRLLGQPDDSSGISWGLGPLWRVGGCREDSWGRQNPQWSGSQIQPGHNKVQVMCGPKTLWEDPIFLPASTTQRRVSFMFAKWLRSWPGPPLLCPTFFPVLPLA